MPVSDPSFVPASATIVGPTTVRLRFSLKPLVNAALTTASNYTVAGNTVSAAATVPGDLNAVNLTLGSLPSLAATILVTVASGVILDSTSTYAITSPGNTVRIPAAANRVELDAAKAKGGGRSVPVAAPTLRAVLAQHAPAKPNPPTVSNYSPANGSHLAATDSFSFDVTADSNGLLNVLVWVALGGLGTEEAVWDGSQFTSQYIAGSTRVAITNGFRYTLKRSSPGWPAGSITPIVRAYDKSGQETVG